jgi:hypothetical protein
MTRREETQYEVSTGSMTLRQRLIVMVSLDGPLTFEIEIPAY